MNIHLFGAVALRAVEVLLCCSWFKAVLSLCLGLKLNIWNKEKDSDPSAEPGAETSSSSNSRYLSGGLEAPCPPEGTREERPI